MTLGTVALDSQAQIPIEARQQFILKWNKPGST